MKRIVMVLCMVSLTQIIGYSQNNQEISTIHEAAALGNARSLLAFLQEGVSANAKDTKGRTPLMAASESGMSRVISLLLERGAEIDAVDNEGNTALHIGASNGQIRVVTDLLEKGANTSIKNAKGFTPKELVSQSGNSRVLSLFPEEAVVYERRTGLEDAFSLAEAESDKLKKVLEDPNEVRSRLSTDPKLVKDMEVLFETLEAEETKWTSRKQRIKNTFFNALRKEIDSEILFVQTVAKQEDANDIVHELDVLQSTWKSIFAKSSRAMREAARGGSTLAMQELTRTSRARSRRGQTTDTLTSRRGTRARSNEAVVEEVDPHESYINNWGSIDDTNLDTIYGSTQEKIVNDMDAIRLSAEKAGKTRILNAIDGVMLERKLRGERSLVVYNLNKEEMAAASNAMNAEGRTARGRRGASTTQTQ
ncbi:MAG: ankyrin repeat domain-containing protein, partial [Phycisphaerae bacterium]|nr:ankyrin repeat domain-containing protein [Phycisphaerae bacterium]